MNYLFYPKNQSDNLILVEQDVIDRTLEYCEARKTNGDHTWYERQRNAKKDKAYGNDFDAKITEYAGAMWLSKMFEFPITEPDFKIYKKNEKSWKADLEYQNVYIYPWKKKYDDLRVHVKSCPEKWSGPNESFVFENNDEIRERGNENDLVLLVLANFTYPDHPSPVPCYIRALVPWTDIPKNAWGEMRLPRHRAQKAPIYTAKLQECLIDRT